MAAINDKAIYYNSNLVGKPFDVLKDNDNGTIDLGANGEVLVKSCPVSKFAKHGHATIGAEPAGAEPVKVPAVEEIGEAEIQRELATNHAAGNDYQKAKELIGYRRSEAAKAKADVTRTIEFRAPSPR